MKKLVLAAGLAVAISTQAHAEGGVLPMAAKPEDVGLSSTQLKRIEAVTQKHVDDRLKRLKDQRGGSSRSDGPISGAARSDRAPTTR